MHTNPVDQNGTDLTKVQQKIAPDAKIIFSTERVDQTKLNWIYNVADVTINIAGNEGFGLTTAESIMAGTPAIINVTGGLQDQLGLRKKSDGKLFTAEDYKKLGSLHNWRKWEDKVTHGEWVKPVWPRVQTMTGSVPTPYIIDDKVDVEEVADAFKYWYDKTPKQRKEAGLKGREAFLGDLGLNSKNQNKCMADGIEKAIKNFKPKPRYKLHKLR